MERNLTDKEKEQIVNFGAFEYTAFKMAAILMWEEKEVEKAMKGGEFLKLYNNGKETRDYVLDVKLFDMARGGDLKALDEFTYRIKQNNGD